MPVEFLGMGAGNDGTETHPRTTSFFDPGYALKIARAHEDNNWDHVLFAYNSTLQDPALQAGWVAAHTQSIQIRLAHRPNVSFPTYAARQFLTLDHLAQGRLSVHFITGGTQADQAREGDYLSKDDRYARTADYIRIIKRAWESPEPFDWDSPFHRFEDFSSGIEPFNGKRPGISFGGSSPAAWEVGAELADVYALFGEPMADAAQQQATVLSLPGAQNRADPLRWQIAFRPIIAETDELAWEKAHRVLGTLQRRRDASEMIDAVRHYAQPVEAAGTQRLLDAAHRASHHDRALWTEPAKATGGGGGSATALVGSYDTVTQAILDYTELGFEIFGLRGYDFLADTQEFGQRVIPQVKAEIARREARSTRGQALESQAAARALAQGKHQTNTYS